MATSGQGSEGQGEGTTIEESSQAYSPQELLEKYRGQKLGGGYKLTAELIDKIRHAWGVEGLTVSEISTVMGLGVSIVQDIVKGILHGTPPPGSKIDVRTLLGSAIPAKPKEPKDPNEPPLVIEKPIDELPETTPISPKIIGQLYMLTLSAGFSNINEFLANELLPVYGIKLRWEVKLGRRVAPKELSDFFEVAASKAVRFDEAVKGMMSPD